MATEKIESTGKKCSVCGGEIVKIVVTREDSELVKACYCQDCGVQYEHLPKPKRRVYCDWGKHYVSPEDAVDLDEAVICKQCHKSILSQFKNVKVDTIGKNQTKRKTRKIYCEFCLKKVTMKKDNSCPECGAVVRIIYA